MVEFEYVKLIQKFCISPFNIEPSSPFDFPYCLTRQPGGEATKQGSHRFFSYYRSSFFFFFTKNNLGVHEIDKILESISNPAQLITRSFNIFTDSLERTGNYLFGSEWVLAAGSVTAAESGDSATAQEYLERLLGMVDGQFEVSWPTALYAAAAPCVAQIAGDSGDVDAAVEAAKYLLESGNAVPQFLLLARSGLAIVALLRGDESAAAELRLELLQRQAYIVRPSVASSDRLLGAGGKVLLSGATPAAPIRGATGLPHGNINPLELFVTRWTALILRQL